MTRARNISNPQAVTLPLTVSANITSNASLAVGNTTITGNQFVNGAVTFANSSANNIFFNTDGTVSIGTSNNVSSRKLQAVGQIAAVTANGYVIVELDSDPAANLGYIGTKSNTAVSIKTNDTGRFYVSTNGNIGVSNTTPGYKLQVTGGAISIDYNQAIRIGNGDWMIGGSNTEISVGSTAVNKTIILYTTGSTPTLKANNTVSLGFNGTFNMPTGYANAYASDTPSLYVLGKGVFSSNTSGSSYPDFRGAALVLGPNQQRSTSSNLYHGGIAFDHLLNYSAGNMGYGGMPHAWIGLKLVDTPGFERSSFVIATRNGTDGTANTIDRLTVAPQGWVTKPYQPSFSAYVNANVTGTSGTVPFNALRYDNGSNFNTSTYAFTAPVAGKYLFTVYDNFTATSGTGAYIYFAVNGTAASAYMYAVAPSSWFLLGGSAVLSLSQNDSVSVLYQGSSLHPDYGSTAWGLFSGILIG